MEVKFVCLNKESCESLLDLEVAEHADVFGVEVLIALGVVPAHSAVPKEVRRAPQTHNARVRHQFMFPKQGEATVDSLDLKLPTILCIKVGGAAATNDYECSCEGGTEASLGVVVSKRLGISEVLWAGTHIGCQLFA